MANVKGTSKCVVSLEQAQKLFDGLNNGQFGEAIGVDLDVLAELTKAIGDPKEIAKMTQPSMLAKFEAIGFEAFVNGLVGSIGTSVINSTANGFMLGWELTKSGLRTASATASANPKQMRAEAQILAGQVADVFNTTADISKLIFTRGQGWQALNDLPLEKFGTHDWLLSAQAGRTKLGGAGTEVEPGLMDRQISAENMGINPKSLGGKAVDVVGGIVNLPGEALRHQDLAAKSMNYRMRLRQLARYRADELGSTDKERGEFFDMLMRHPTEQIIQAAANTANRNTFTEEMGTLGSKARAILQVPGLRWLTPFFRTLWNITEHSIRESPIGELNRMSGSERDISENLLAWKGQSYLKNLTSRSPIGDAARAQAAASTLMSATMLSYLDKKVEQDGYGWRGAVDMTSESGRLSADTIAPPFSYTMQDGAVLDFSQIEPLRTQVALHLGIQEALQYVEVVNETTGEFTTTGAQLTEIIKTVGEHLAGNFFAAESTEKLTNLYKLMASSDAGASLQARGQLADIVASFATPRYLSDAAELMDGEYRRAHTLLEQIKKNIPGLSGDLGTYRTLWGEEKTPRGVMSLPYQSSTFTGKREPDAIDFLLNELEVNFLDNPKKVTIPGTGAKVNLDTHQTQALMDIAGTGGTIELINGNSVQLPPLKETISAVAGSPAFNQLRIPAKKALIEDVIRKKQQAAIGIIYAKDTTLQEQVMQQKRNLIALGQGDMISQVPVDMAYLRALFAGQQATLVRTDQ